MTLHEKVVHLAQQRYPDIDVATLRIIPTLSKNVEIISNGDVVEMITMDWLDATGNPMIGWGPKTNTLIVYRRLIALFRADVLASQMDCRNSMKKYGFITWIWVA